MALIRKGDSFPERPVIIVLYGTPGVGKTSLFNTSENPILIDCDRGADRAIFKQDTIIAKNWKDILADESEIKNYKTIGIDTAKAVLDDFLMVHVVDKDYKLKTNKLKAYGAIGEEFKMFINNRRAEGLDIVIIAHAKEEKDGDITKLSPDVTGQSKDLILRIADQVGFVTMENKQRVITFEPTDRTIGKNVARIPTTVIPDESDPNFKTFMGNIIWKVKQSISKRSEEQIEAQRIMDEFATMVNECTTSDDLVGLFEVAGNMKEHQRAAAKKLIATKADNLGLKYNTTTSSFIAK